MDDHPLNAVVESLPNGFHDAILHAITVTLDEGVVEFTLYPDVSHPDDVQMEHRPGLLRIDQVAFLQIAPTLLSERQKDGYRVDVVPLQDGILRRMAGRTLPAACRGIELSIADTGSALYVGGEGFSFGWSGEDVM